MNFGNENRLRTYMARRGFSVAEQEYAVAVARFITAGVLPLKPYPPRWREVQRDLPAWIGSAP